jgi:hypothetical protein
MTKLKAAFRNFSNAPKNDFLLLTTLTDQFFIIEMEIVYCAVRIGSLDKTDNNLSLKS